jgi:queuine/archaeosine tRNA-ribosyltransferase
LISIHNLRALIRLMEYIRAVISEGMFESEAPRLLERWSNNAKRNKHNPLKTGTSGEKANEGALQ